MGGNIVMNYAGVQPARIRRLVNLEGFGLPRAEASKRPAAWRAGSTTCATRVRCAPLPA
jgi:pimeloyl-ACP methyl ester carboxylesterase